MRSQNPTTILLLILAAVALAVSPSCKRKGDLRPPEAQEPEVTPDDEAETAEEPEGIPPLEGEIASAIQVRGEAGYDEPSMAAFGDACIAGQVPADPQHVFTVVTATSVEIIARADDDDLSLVVAGPGGPYCSDDYDNLDPGLQLQLEPGEYQVFVGTYTDQPIDPTPDYTLVLQDPSDAAPRNPILALFDDRLEELIETSQPVQREQLERLRVLINSLATRGSEPIRIENVEQLRRVTERLQLSDAERAEVDALIERLEDGNEEAPADAPQEEETTPDTDETQE